MTSSNTKQAPSSGGALYEEIEIGPHFLTFYTKDYVKMLEDGKYLYTQLNAYLQTINPPGLEHVDRDPNMYHPFGEPNSFRPYFRHFHIRYGRQVAVKDISAVLRLNILQLKPGYTVSRLEDNKLPHLAHLQYPELKEEDDYMEYIHMLRKGDWIYNGK